MVRDHNGKLCEGRKCLFVWCFYPLVEMVATWNDIKAEIFCTEAKKLWIEGDALGICMALRKGSGVDGYVVNFLQDIKGWFHTLEEWKVSHILWEGNTPTDFMTVGVSKDIAIVYSMSNLSSELYNLINLDIRCYGRERKH